MSKYYRHGDVGLIEAALPKGAKRLDPKICRCAQFEICAMHLVLAHGEVSGHAHRFDYKNDQIEIYEKDGQIFIKNTGHKPASLAQTHGTTADINLENLSQIYEAEGLHAPIKEAVKPGSVFTVRFPGEYNWAEKEMQRAID